MVKNGDTGKQDYITVGGSTEFDDDDAALEALVQLKELTFGDVFNERNTTLDSEESDGISIIFYHTETRNRLQVYTTEEGHVHITCSLVGDSALEMQDICETVADEVGEILIGHSTAVRFIDVGFDSLDFPIHEDTDHNVTGIRITEPEANYIVQATEEHGVSFISRDRRFDEVENLRDISPLGTYDWEAVDEFISKFE